MDLLRHGATVMNGRYCGSTDVALSDEGYAAMQRSTEGKRWRRIVSSPLARCARFAEVLSATLRVPLHIDARWRELHFGEWEGRHASEIDEDALGAFWRDPIAHAPPGSEPLTAMQSRVQTASEEWLADADHHGTLVITHGGPIRVLLAAAQGLPLHRAHEIEVPLASLHRWPPPFVETPSCKRC